MIKASKKCLVTRCCLLPDASVVKSQHRGMNHRPHRLSPVNEEKDVSVYIPQLLWSIKYQLALQGYQILAHCQHTPTHLNPKKRLFLSPEQTQLTCKNFWRLKCWKARSLYNLCSSISASTLYNIENTIYVCAISI